MPARPTNLRDVSSDIQSSPLEAAHQALGAKLVPFAGWNMPIQYSSIMDEHNAVRSGCGIFDISHMGQVIVSGEHAAPWLNRLLTNNITKLEVGQGQYTLMLNEDAGVIDDLIAYRTGESTYFLVVNASKIAEDLAWMHARQSDGVTITDESPKWAGMAIQGPDSAKVFATVFPAETLPPRNGIATTACGCIVCRTGYTGEDGFEIFTPIADATAVWDKFLAAGSKPCGLGARDSLRLEMGYPLNGSDLSIIHTPVEAGLGFFCDLEKGDFIGLPRRLRRRNPHRRPHQRRAFTDPQDRHRHGLPADGILENRHPRRHRGARSRVPRRSGEKTLPQARPLISISSPTTS